MRPTAQDVKNHDIIKFSTPPNTMIDYHALRDAAQCDDVEQIQHWSPSLNNLQKGVGLALAAFYGGAEVVRYLSPWCSTSQHHDALSKAVVMGHHAVVDVLLPQCHIEPDNTYFLRLAVEHHHEPLIDLLFPLSDARTALKFLQFDYDEGVWGCLAQRIKAQEEQQILNEHVQSSVSKTLRKI